MSLLQNLQSGGGRESERERGLGLGYHINDCYQKGYAQPILRLYMHASWYKEKVETDVNVGGLKR